MLHSGLCRIRTSVVHTEVVWDNVARVYAIRDYVTWYTVSESHVHIYSIRWFKEDWWKYFCRFVFVCFTLLYKHHKQLKFHDLKEI